jgi:tetratricopeptide (TPR) repeat protein
MHGKRLLRQWMLLSLILLSLFGCKSSTAPDQPPQKFKFPPLEWAKALAALIKPAIPNTVVTLEEQAQRFQGKGRLDLAEKQYRLALTIRESGWGAQHLNVVHSLDVLATYYMSQGRYAEAEPLLQRSLAIKEKELTQQHPDVADTLEQYAELLRKTGRDTEAMPLAQRAQTIRGK